MQRASSAPQTALGEIVRISPPGAGDFMDQLFANAHPTDGRHLIACGMLWARQYAASSGTWGYAYVSSDNGAIWHRTILENSTGWVSEENCTYDQDSTAYFVAGASNVYNEKEHHETGHLHVFASNDYGSTWRRTYTRAAGWIDWTYLATIPGRNTQSNTFVIFGNAGTDRLGHWAPLQPVAIASTDGGRRFSDLAAPREGRQFQYMYANGSSVLSDGTALFIAAGERSRAKSKSLKHATSREEVDIFAYSPRNKTLSLRSTIASYEDTREPHHLFFTSLAQDRSSGPHSGRLYAAWVVTNQEDRHGGAVSMMLATSDDGGFHWTSRTLLGRTGLWSSSSCKGQSVPQEIHIAVGPDGTLGVLWSENLRDLLFVSSRNGGQTFSPSVVVTTYTSTPDMYIYFAEPSDGYALGESLALDAGKPYQTIKRWNTSPGLSVYMVSQNLAANSQSLVVDARGTFHAFWSLPPKNSDVNALFTRSINPTFSAAGTQMLSDPTPPSSCYFLTAEQVHAALPLSPPVMKVPPSLHDVTKTIAIDSSIKYRYDRPAQTIRIDATFVNTGKQPLRFPLTVVATNLHSDFGTPIPLNARGTVDGQPAWRLSTTLGDELQPKVHTKPLRLEFYISNFHLPPSLFYAHGDGVAMKIRVYEPRMWRGALHRSRLP